MIESWGRGRMMGRGLRPNRAWAMGFALVAAIAFQACQRSSYYSSSFPNPNQGVLLASGGGDGTGYEGQIARYIHVDPAQACADHGTIPKIWITTTAQGKTAQLVRNQCAAVVPPQALSLSSITFATDG